jgi:uncharacterized protein (TIGR01777 family)
MRVLVSGSRGFIGSALVEYLQGQGHQISRLVRKGSVKKMDDFVWSPDEGYIDKLAFVDCDAVVHLAAENVSGRWTKEKMHKIRQSRVQGAKVLCDAIKELGDWNGVYVSASGIGYYGDRADELIAEGQPSGTDFLALVSRDREAVSNELEKYGVRVVNTRFGMVLGDGGALKKMLGAFQTGLGATFGNGKQYWSWITRKDAVRAIVHAINEKSVSGAVNVVSPQPVTNKEFAITLAQVLGKPQFLTIPDFVARLMFGKLADNLLLCSIRAEPRKLFDTGFVFDHPNLKEALASILSDHL